MCEALELGLALLGSLAVGLTRWAMRVAADAARVVKATPARGPPRSPARGYEEEWDMV